MHTVDPAARYITTRPINQDVGSDECFAMASQWLEECHTSHSECFTNAVDDDFMPSIVIDVGSADTGNKKGNPPRLHIPQKGDRGRWSCLSYCWGGDQIVTTTKQMKLHFMDSIPWVLIPKTIQDAITVTRVLGIPYIWVDSFCVIQDDPEEVTRQISLMPKIYQKAFVTIIASSAGTSTQGFLEKRTIRSSDCPIFSWRYHCPNGQLGSIYFFADDGYDPREDPVRKRAWTLQERLLSSRILDYGSRQMQWACRTVRRGAGGFRNPIPSGAEATEWLKPRYLREPGPNDANMTDYEKVDGFITWAYICAGYKGRRLSKESDTLPAISGIARRYSHALNARYLAGMFYEDIPWCLPWIVVPGSQKQRPKYRAPSWSWASVDSPVGPPSRTTASVQNRFDVLDAQIDLESDEAPYGRVCGGLLRVRGFVKKSIWSGSNFFGEGRGHIPGLRAGYFAQVDAIEEATLPLFQGKSIQVFLLDVAEGILVLVSSDNAYYKRIGAGEGGFGARQRAGERSGSNDWEWKELTIV